MFEKSMMKTGMLALVFIAAVCMMVGAVSAAPVVSDSEPLIVQANINPDTIGISVTGTAVNNWMMNRGPNVIEGVSLNVVSNVGWSVSVSDAMDINKAGSDGTGDPATPNLRGYMLPYVETQYTDAKLTNPLGIYFPGRVDWTVLTTSSPTLTLTDIGNKSIPFDLKQEIVSGDTVLDSGYYRMSILFTATTV